MYTHPVRDDMACGRVACTGVVRLRWSPVERLLVALRWMATLAGVVVVLWVGAAFLASPASAAVAVPATLVAPMGAQKGGSSSESSGSGKKKSGKKKSDKKKSGEKKSGEKKSDKKKSDKKKSGEEKPDKKKADKKKSGEKKSGEEKSDKKKSDKKEAHRKEVDQGEVGEKREEKGNRNGKGSRDAGRHSRGREEVERRSDDDERSEGAEARDKKGGKRGAAVARDRREGSTGSHDTQERRRRGDGEKSASERPTSQTGVTTAVEKREKTRKAKGTAAQEKRRKKTVGHEDDRVRGVRAQRDEADRAVGEHLRKARKKVEGGDDGPREVTGSDLAPAAVKAMVTTGTKKVKKTKKTKDEAEPVPLLSSAGPQDSGEKQDRGSGTVRLRKGEDGDARAPPRGARSKTDEETETDGDVDYDDSAAHTERVLQGRVKVENSEKKLDKSKKKLATAKKKLASGGMTKAQYKKQSAAHKKQSAAHKKLQQRVAADGAELSPERSELVDRVISGQRKLSGQEKKLAAERKKVKAGKTSKKTYQKHAAALERQRTKVYDATDELMEATDHDRDVVPDDGVDGGGSAAGCGSSGSFVVCGSVTEDADGEVDRDRCVAVSGASSGCGVSSRSGSNTASAKCVLSGSGKGCGSKASSKDAGGRATAASARCTGRCDLSTRADTAAADASCRAGAGSCETRGTGSDRGTDPARQVRAADAQDVPGAAAHRRRQGTATARCGAGAGACDTTSGVDLGERSGDGRVAATSDTSCADGAGRCTGWTGTRTTAGHDAASPNAAARNVRRNGGSASATSATASCEVGAGSCHSHSDSTPGGDDAGTAANSAAATTVDCDGARCRGEGTTTTTGVSNGARAGAARTSGGSTSCEVRGGSCEGRSATAVRTAVAEESAAGAGAGVARDGEATATSTADADVDCADATGCAGKASTTTRGRVTGAAVRGQVPVRTTGAGATCTAAAGACAAGSRSEVADQAAIADVVAVAGHPAARELTASSTAASRVECAAAQCRGSATGTTSGAASGDVEGVRDSTGSARCTARGGACEAGTDTTVADRDPITARAAGLAVVSGPVSVSHATAAVECSGGTGTCGGTAKSATSARDTGVSLHARGSSASAECSVTGGGCSGATSSGASSAPDHVVTDPVTGKPVAGQPLTGPSSTSSSSAGLDCPNGCTGRVRTSTTAWDGAVAGGTPRTSTGQAACTGGAGACEARSVSQASSGPGAALALTGGQVGAQQVNTARLGKGPSAASTAGATLACDGAGTCSGEVSSSATATDPVVSQNARGSRSEGSCAGVSGGVCQAVSNSAASSSQDANSIAPLVAARSTDNATVSSGPIGGEQAPAEQEQLPGGGDQQPATPPAPTAPGASANSGGPTVPGASSWTMASASLDCPGGAGGCTGTARTSASGSDGPEVLNGAGGARGPPEGRTGSSGSCTSTQSGCHVQTDSSAGSGQVVADVVAEQQNSAATQAAAQATQAEQAGREAAEVAARPGATAAQRRAATEAATIARQARTDATAAAALAGKPVENPPATLSQSSAGAQCAGAGCAATTTGNTGGLPGTATTGAGCAAAGSMGCAAVSEATAATHRDSGQPAGTAKKGTTARNLPGRSGEAEAASQLSCPEVGCTGTLTARAGATVGGKGPRSTSTAKGTTRCDGTAVCLARISAATSTAVTGRSVAADESFGTTTAQVSAACDDGTATGCATEASSRTTATGGAGVRTRAAATCATAAACQVATGGFATKGVAEATAGCAGTGCRTATLGTASAGANHATSRTSCAAGGDGQCAGSSRVGATADGAQVSASCQASKGSTCRHAYSARSSSFSAAGGSTATAGAGCHGGGGTGRGWCATSAQTQAGGGSSSAAAACQGSKGSNCRYSYSSRSAASASAPGAQARASASCGATGGRGQGWCATSAQAQAAALPDGAAASASASCQGSAGSNCRRSYYAHAVAHDAGYLAPQIGVPGWDSVAHGEGTCSGGGGAGSGGCGVEAHALAGPGGYGYAACSGDCANFVDASYFHFTPLAPLPPPVVVTTTEEGPATDDPEEELGEEEGTVGVNCISVNLCNSYNSETGETKDCLVSSCEATGRGGIRAGYDHAEDPRTGRSTGKRSTGYATTPGRNRLETRRGGVEVSRHQYGYSGRVYGHGSAYDGRTRTTVNYHGGANRVTFSNNSKGVPFTSTCRGGCHGTISRVAGSMGRVTDHFDLEKGSSGLLTVGKQKGDRRLVTFAGTFGDGGSTFRSAEGDRLTLERGSAQILTRDQHHLNGYLSISGIGGTSGRGTMTSAENVTSTCRDCLSVTHLMPSKKGKPGARGTVGTTLCRPGTGSCTISDSWEPWDRSHDGWAKTSCSGGGSGAGHCVAVVDAHWDPDERQVVASADCESGGGGRCGRSEVTAWARHPEINRSGKTVEYHHREWTGDGAAGVVAFARKLPGGTTRDDNHPGRPYSVGDRYDFGGGGSCTSDAGTCRGASWDSVDYREGLSHIVGGRTCADAGEGSCSLGGQINYDGMAHEAALQSDCRAGGSSRCGRALFHAGSNATFEKGKGIAGRGRCDFTGGGRCSVVAGAEKRYVKANNAWTVVASGGCQADAKDACEYGVTGNLNATSGKNAALADQACGRRGTGYCGITMQVQAQGADDVHQTLASAVAQCHDSNKASTCRGSFFSHADSNRDTQTTCAGHGQGECTSKATPVAAESWGKGNIWIFARTPSEKVQRRFRDGGRLGADLDLDGGWFIGFGKNTIRDVGYNVWHLPGTVGHLAKASVREFENGFKICGPCGLFPGVPQGFAATAIAVEELGGPRADLPGVRPRGADETWEGYLAEAMPFGGGMVQGSVGLFRKESGGLGTQFYGSPLTSTLALAGPVLMFLPGPKGMGAAARAGTLKPTATATVTRGTVGAAVREAAVRATLGRRAGRWTVPAKVATPLRVVASVPALPYVGLGVGGIAAGRLLARTAPGRVVGKSIGRAAEAMAGRAVTAGIMRHPTANGMRPPWRAGYWAAVAASLHATTRWLDRAAHTESLFGRTRHPGSFEAMVTDVARQTGAGRAEVLAALADAAGSAQLLDGIDSALGGGPRRPVDEVAAELGTTPEHVGLLTRADPHGRFVERDGYVEALAAGRFITRIADGRVAKGVWGATLAVTLMNRALMGDVSAGPGRGSPGLRAAHSVVDQRGTPAGGKPIGKTGPAAGERVPGSSGPVRASATGDPLRTHPVVQQGSDPVGAPQAHGAAGKGTANEIPSAPERGWGQMQSPAFTAFALDDEWFLGGGGGGPPRVGNPDIRDRSEQELQQTVKANWDWARERQAQGQAAAHSVARSAELARHAAERAEQERGTHPRIASAQRKIDSLRRQLAEARGRPSSGLRKQLALAIAEKQRLEDERAARVERAVREGVDEVARLQVELRDAKAALAEAVPRGRKDVSSAEAELLHELQAQVQAAKAALARANLRPAVRAWGEAYGDYIGAEDAYRRDASRQNRAIRDGARGRLQKAAAEVGKLGRERAPLRSGRLSRSGANVESLVGWWSTPGTPLVVEKGLAELLGRTFDGADPRAVPALAAELAGLLDATRTSVAVGDDALAKFNDRHQLGWDAAARRQFAAVLRARGLPVDYVPETGDLRLAVRGRAPPDVETPMGSERSRGSTEFAARHALSWDPVRGEFLKAPRVPDARWHAAPAGTVARAAGAALDESRPGPETDPGRAHPMPLLPDARRGSTHRIGSSGSDRPRRATRATVVGATALTGGVIAVLGAGAVAPMLIGAGAAVAGWGALVLLRLIRGARGPPGLLETSFTGAVPLFGTLALVGAATPFVVVVGAGFAATVGVLAGLRAVAPHGQGALRGAAAYEAIANNGIDSARARGTGGGAVARRPLTEADRAAVLGALAGLRDRMTPLEQLPHRMPRGPPGVEVLVPEGELPVPGVIAFGWAERGVVVVPRSVVDQVAVRYARAPDAVQGWWDRLLTHEREFHLGAHPEHTGRRHDRAAARLAREFPAEPRARVDQQRTGPDERLVRAVLAHDHWGRVLGSVYVLRDVLHAARLRAANGAHELTSGPVGSWVRDAAPAGFGIGVTLAVLGSDSPVARVGWLVTGVSAAAVIGWDVVTAKERVVRGGWSDRELRALGVLASSLVVVTAFQAVASNAAFALRGGVNLVPSRGGALGALARMVLMATFVVNVAWLGYSTATGSGLDARISGFYAVTIAMFGLGALGAAGHGARGWQERAHLVAAWAVTWVAFPITSNVGNALLTLKLGWVAFDPLMLSATVVLSVAFAYSSLLGMVEAVRPGRVGGPYAAVMGAVGNASLLYWGLFALWPGHWVPLVVAGAAPGTVLAARRLSKFLEWRARLIHSPTTSRSPAAVFLGLVVDVAPGLLRTGLVIGAVLWADLGAPMTITVLSGLATVIGLRVLHRVVPPAAGRLLTPEDLRRLVTVVLLVPVLWVVMGVLGGTAHGDVLGAREPVSADAPAWLARAVVLAAVVGLAWWKRTAGSAEPASPTTGGGPGAGAVALGGLSREAVELLLVWLPTVVRHLRPLGEVVSGMPPGPPGGATVLVLDTDAIEEPIPPAVADVLNRLVAFGWPAADAMTGGGGVVVMTAATVAEVHGHLAAGRLEAGWWVRLLAHEADFHLTGRRDARDPAHEADVDALVDALRTARRGSTGQVGGVAGSAPRLVVTPDLPTDLSSGDRWLSGLDAVTPRERWQEVRLAGVPFTAFTGAKIGALADVMAALRVGGVLIIQTGERVEPFLPEVLDVLRQLGAGSVESYPRPRRIIAVKTARTGARAQGHVHRLATGRAGDPAPPDGPQGTRVIDPVVDPVGRDAYEREVAARITAVFAQSERDWVLPHWLRDELDADEGTLRVAARSSRNLLLVSGESGDTRIVAVDEAAMRAGFHGMVLDGRPAVRLTGGTGTLVIDGRQSEPGTGTTNLAVFLDWLTEYSATWALSADAGVASRDAAMELLARAWLAGEEPVAQAGQLVLRRVDLGAPVARLPDASTTGLLDLHTLRLGADRELLLEVSPVAPGTDYGPAFVAGYPAGSVVRIGVGRGAIGSGVVVRAAEPAGDGRPARPARVLTALHVVRSYLEKYTAHGPLVAAGRRVGNWTTVQLDEYGTDQALAAEAVRRWGDVVPMTTVDLALLEVDGLDLPAVPVRGGPVGIGERLALTGFPQAHELTAQGPVAVDAAGHFAVAVLFGPGVSGGPALDADHHIAGIAAFGLDYDSRVYLVGPALIAAFLARAGPKLDGLGRTGRGRPGRRGRGDDTGSAPAGYMIASGVLAGPVALAVLTGTGALPVLLAWIGAGVGLGAFALLRYLRSVRGPPSGVSAVLDGALPLGQLESIEEEALRSVLPTLPFQLLKPRRWRGSRRGPRVAVRVVSAEALGSALNDYYAARRSAVADGRDTLARVAAYTVDGAVYLADQRLMGLDRPLLGDVIAYEDDYRVRGTGDLAAQVGRAADLAARVRAAEARSLAVAEAYLGARAARSGRVLAAWYGLRGAPRTVRGRVADLQHELSHGSVGSWVRDVSPLGAGAGAGLVVLGSGTPVESAGWAVTGVSAAAGMLSRPSPRWPRAPPWRRWARDVRAALDARVARGAELVREQAGWWAAVARFEVAVVRGWVRLLPRVERWSRTTLRVRVGEWQFTLTWENRVYPTWLQTLVARIPVVGPWLAGSFAFHQLLHLKLKKFSDTAKVWRGTSKDGPRGFRARAYVARLRYNRAFTSGFPWMTPPAGPEWQWGPFEIGLKYSCGNLGTCTVLDVADLGGRTHNRNRVAGAFPVARMSFQVYFGDVRLEVFLLHFDVLGKQLEPEYPRATLVGRRRFNLPRRLWHRLRALNWRASSWEPLRFLSQFQIGMGVGPRSPLLPNYLEYRASGQTVQVHRNRKPVWEKPVNLAQDVGPKFVPWLIRKSTGPLVRRLPRSWRTDAAIGWTLWLRVVARRRSAYDAVLRGRALRHLDDVIDEQEARLQRVRRERRAVENLIRAVSDADVVPTAGPKHAVLTAEGRRWRRLRDLEQKLQDAINDNRAARGALENGP